MLKAKWILLGVLSVLLSVRLCICMHKRYKTFCECEHLPHRVAIYTHNVEMYKIDGEFQTN